MTPNPLGLSSKDAGANPRPRIAWIDIAKGIAITLVVYGHVMQGAIHREMLRSPQLAIFSLDLIYTFHMPAFFFVSGLFIGPALRRSAGEFLKGRFRTILWPYLLWSVIGALSAAAFRNFYSNPSANPIRSLINIFWDTGGFWFLYVLFLTQVLALLFRPVPKHISLAFGIVLYFLGSKFEIAVVTKLTSFLPYLFAGICCEPFVEHISNVPRRITMLAFAILGGIQCSAVQFGLHAIPAVNLLLGFSGTLWLIAAARLLEGARSARAFGTVGSASLVVFLLHPYFQGVTREVLFHVARCHSPLVHVVLQTAAGVLGSTVCWLLSTKYGFWFLFTLKNPNQTKMPVQKH
jgi:fucose 4-O-acetylase-like acetyltransferase